jgi:hypothetical protein
MRAPVPAFIISLVIATASIRAGAAPAPTVDELRARLDAIAARLPEFRKQIADLRAGGQDVAYPLVPFTVLENFTGYAIEDLRNPVPNLWGMTAVSGADLSYEPVGDAHAGRTAARIVHRSARAGNVYGMLENASVATLKAGKPYTLSVWAKIDDAASLSLPVDAGWSSRLALASTGGKWQRFAKTFQPAAADTQFKPRILSESPTAGAVVDDVCLVEGAGPEAGKNLVGNAGFEESWTAARVAREIGDMEAMTQRLAAQLEGAKTTPLPRVPRWSGNKRPRVSGPSFIDPNTNRPIFFLGYGHFQQVRNDIERFPGYGINCVQHGEMGPAQVFPKENEIDEKPINNLIGELDRAEKAGVAVDFLMSPHYFPQWMFDKYPHLRKARIDFFPFSIYAPEGRALVKRFVDYVMPKIKDKPALLSVCLSNEPINWQEPDEFSTAAWRTWLKQRHGDVATLNARWKTSYPSLDDIKQPNATDMAFGHKTGAAWCDFVRWNQEYFAQFHKDLADMVHAVAPNVPVHAKSTTWHLYRAENITSGDDPTLLGGVTDINGNDSVNLWSFNERGGDLIERGTTDFAQGWRENALGYELQRSAHDAPVFNSENHVIFDRETRYVDPAHVRAALWMGAVHGQSATTIWVWEREKSNPVGDLAGGIMERPGCAEAVGIACHDLNRVAPQITALQNAPPDVHIIQCNSAAVWDPGYQDALVKVFTALSFTGLKIGFVTERQLEQGKIVDGKILFVPACAHVSDAAFAALRNYRGKIVFVGEKLLAKNEYDQPRDGRIEAATTVAAGKTWQDSLKALRPALDHAKIEPAVKIALDKADWGVQWQTAPTPEGLIVNLYNARHDPMTLSLPAAAVNLLTGQAIASGEKITLAPLEVRLLRIAP